MARLTFVDRIVMSSICELRILVPFLLADDVRVRLNLPMKGELKRGEIADGVKRLLLSRLIEIDDGTGQGLRPPEALAALHARYDLADIPARTEMPRVGLTRKGALVWERYARPRWSLFLSEEEPKSRGGRLWLRFACGSKALATGIKGLIDDRDLFPDRVHKIVEVENWRPLYWKRRARGYLIEINTGLPWGSVKAEEYRVGLG